MKPKHQRMLFVGGAVCVMAVAATIILQRFSENLLYFYTPSLLSEKLANPAFDKTRAFRLGGLVKPGSVKRSPPDHLRFIVTDGTGEYTVSYRGMPPTLFREGQGVVMLGTLSEKGTVKASEILAKHDEKYMPPEVAKALKDSGQWKGKGAANK